MLRYMATLRYCCTAVRNGNLYQRNGFHFNTTAASSVVQNAGTDVAESSNQDVPKWVKGSVDRDLFVASDIASLFAVSRGPNFNRKNAVNLLAVLTSWVTEGRAKPEEVSAHASSLENVLSVLSKDNNNLGMTALVQSLRNLMSLGMKSDSFVIKALQNELLWNLRKLNLRQQLQVLNFEKDLEKTAEQEKIVDEAVHNIQRRWVEITDAKDFVSILVLSRYFEEPFLAKLEDRCVELVESFTTDDKAKIVIALASSRRRPVPLLRALAFHLGKSKDVLSPRILSDLLFAMNRLNLHDTLLLEKACSDFVAGLPQVKNSAIVGSVLTSLGQLRFRHAGILEALCEWVDQNLGQCRVQDLVSTVLCLGAVNFTPSNAEQLIPKLTGRLKRDSIPSTSVWLDVVWSLAILDQLPKEMLNTVLNPAAVKELTATEGPQSHGVLLKLNNLAGLTKLAKEKYGGNAVEVPSPWDSVPSGETPPLTRSVMDALGNFVPPPKYLKENVRTDFGVRIDGLCVLNSDCTPQLLSKYENTAEQLPPNSHRIAVTVLDYKDLCLGSSHLTGISALGQRLLTLAGYKVVAVSFREFSAKDKLLKKVQFLEHVIKDAIATPTSANKE